ncbi:MAG: hypothetical protein ABIO80_09970 [Sphingomicrobium sp.]
MAVLPHPPRLPVEPSDKIQHIIAFLTITLIGSIGYPRVKPLKLLVLLSLFGAAIELFQAIPALHRDSDIFDWVADTAAAGLVVALAYWWRIRAGCRA